MASSANESAGSAHASPEAARIQKAIETVKPKIQQILLKYNGEPAGNGLCLISPAHEIKHMCIDADLAYTRNVFGRNCGVHPASREGDGLDHVHAQNLALFITFRRFSEEELEDPMCFEPAGTETAESVKRRDLQLELNARTFAEASGHLRTIPHYDLMYLSVTCSHTFAALNIMEGGCQGLHTELLLGCFSTEIPNILMSYPSWGKPMKEGIPCTVFRRELEEACPELPAFLSKAGNMHPGFTTNPDFHKELVRDYIDWRRMEGTMPYDGWFAELGLNWDTDTESDDESTEPERKKGKLESALGGG